MKPFRERNPVPIGIVSLAVLAAGVYTAFHAQDLTIFGGGGKKYYAYFPQAGDLNTTLLQHSQAIADISKLMLAER